jgi:hypothetical protein
LKNMPLIDLNLPIYPAKGIGDITLGFPARKLVKDIIEIECSQIRKRAWLWRTYEFSLWDSIDFDIDIFTGELKEIKVYGNFSGKVDGKIGIGSTVRELREWNPDLSFDEYLIAVGEGDLIIMTDYNDGDDIPSIEEVLDNKIISIKIAIPAWNIEGWE